MTAEQRQRVEAIRHWVEEGHGLYPERRDDVRWLISLLDAPVSVPGVDEERLRQIEKDVGMGAMQAAEAKGWLWRLGQHLNHLLALVRELSARLAFFSDSGEAQMYEAGLAQGKREAAERCREIARVNAATFREHSHASDVAEAIAAEFGLR